MEAASLRNASTPTVTLGRRHSPSRAIALEQLRRPENLRWRERFWAKVHPEPNTGCWLWAGGVHSIGYGVTTFRKLPLLAHRVAFALHTRLLMPGEDVLHSCDVPLCVNPAHLRAGSQAENNADMVRRRRQVEGVRHGRAKLTLENVLHVRAELAAGRRPADMARRYGVSIATIQNIGNRDSYPDVVEQACAKRSRDGAVSGDFSGEAFSGLLPNMAKPHGTDVYGLTPRQQEAAALGTLRDAHVLVQRGWLTWKAISEAGEGGITAEYARRLVRRVIGHHDIPGWDAHAFRTKAERLRVLGAACVLAGGKPPQRGGWKLTTKQEGKQ